MVIDNLHSAASRQRLVREVPDLPRWSHGRAKWSSSIWWKQTKRMRSSCRRLFSSLFQENAPTTVKLLCRTMEVRAGGTAKRCRAETSASRASTLVILCWTRTATLSHTSLVSGSKLWNSFQSHLKWKGYLVEPCASQWKLWAFV